MILKPGVLTSLVTVLGVCLTVVPGSALGATVLFDSGPGGDASSFVATTGATLLEGFEAETPGALPESPATYTTANGLVLETASTSANNPKWRIQSGTSLYGAPVPEGSTAVVWNYTSTGGNHTATVTFPRPVSGFGFDYCDIGDVAGRESWFTITASDGTVVYDYDGPAEGLFANNTNRFVGVYDDNGAPRFTGFTIEFSTNANDNHFLDAIHTSPVAASGLIVARYRDDFQGTSFPPAWKYQWNPANVDISDPTHYADLLWTGSAWDEDGLSGPTPGSGAAGYLLLNPSGGHPGRPPSNSDDDLEHYAVAAFTVPFTAPYSLVDSYLNVINASSNGVEVLVYLGSDAANPILSKVIGGGQADSGDSFDTPLGWLTAGETVYVAVGPNGNSGYDTFNQFDFSIMVVPEPGSLTLAAVGLVGLLVFVRRRRGN